MERGLFNRHLIDFNGYHLLAMHLFPDDDERRSFLAVMTRYFEWIHLVTLKSLAPEDFNWYTFEDKLLDFGYSRLKLLYVRCRASRRLLSLTKYARRILHKSN